MNTSCIPEFNTPEERIAFYETIFDELREFIELHTEDHATSLGDNGTEQGEESNLNAMLHQKDPEAMPDDAQSAVDIQGKIKLLNDYYTSREWLHDYELDEQGLLPPGLKRGVLSQDAVYDLLEEHCLKKYGNL